MRKVARAMEAAAFVKAIAGERLKRRSRSVMVIVTLEEGEGEMGNVSRVLVKKL